jgi:hypothetical protein
MATVTIKNSLSALDAETRKKSLEKLESKISTKNLLFLAELASKKGINEKLESKKALIKSFI